jgi:hypothetical protein
VFERARGERDDAGNGLALEHEVFKSNRFGRHREQSEAIQTQGLRRRLSLDRFALLAMTRKVLSI